MTRKGKIARLPYAIRDELNARLHNGEAGAKLVPWLNELPEVRAVTAREFEGRPVTEQNLSEWKLGGYKDWLCHQETRTWVRRLADESADLEKDAGDYSVADWLSAPLAVALGRWVHEIASGGESDAEERKVLLTVARELTLLRRGDHEEQWLRLARERWETAQKQAGFGNGTPPRALSFSAELLSSAVKAGAAAGRATEPKETPREVKAFNELMEKSPEGEIFDNGRPEVEFSAISPTKSNQIRPNPTKGGETRS